MEMREHGFLFCVGAEEEAARLCPGGSLAGLKELITGNTAEALQGRAELVCSLSRWHEKARALEESGYRESPLTMDELQLLPAAAFKQLFQEAFAAILRDSRQTVEAAAQKKSEDQGSS